MAMTDGGSLVSSIDVTNAETTGMEPELLILFLIKLDYNRKQTKIFLKIKVIQMRYHGGQMGRLFLSFDIPVARE
jgi:hypothetical protein